ncbi:MAG: outer membrane protein transport protein, partial [Planctomycetaceae bacterium]|nr:outer membrane protein transport protein [Planctomycetaceae bacterium]
QGPRMIHAHFTIRVAFFSVLCLFSLIADSAPTQGIYVSTAGPVNRSMGGASTAAPVDALGSLYWNPATISALEDSEVDFSLDLLQINHKVSSSIGGFSGTTNGEPGVFPLPNVGWVFRPADSLFTFGLAVNAIAGFKTNLPSDPTNPVLAPAPVGLGRVSSEANFLQLAPVVSVNLTSNMSFAIGPTITVGQIGIEPFVFDTPIANGAYSPGRASRYHWGGGIQAGVYYVPNCEWHFGASVKSPTWMERFRFFGEDATGAPRVLHTEIELPLIVSVGTGYTGFEDWLFAVDLRYFDYANTKGFGEPAIFDATGKLQGLDWSSVFSLAAGVQRRLTQQILLRAGYTYNQNPVKNSEAFFNIASPLIYQHMVSAGATLELTEKMDFNVAYSYLADISREGTVVLPGAGTIPGSSFTNNLSAHFLSIGISSRY